jgi:hypothetical protein
VAGQASRLRSTSRVVARKPACVPLLQMYQDAEQSRPRTWAEVEPSFVAAMEAFDRNVASGLADQGDRQNGKGDFLNDLVALLLENCTELKLFSRRGLPGFVFPRHNLDVTYPNAGIVKFTLEVKAAGTPRHPKSPKQEPIGRPGSADLPKRIKEAAFKTIDLKAEYGRIMAARGEVASAPSGNLTSWLHSVPPKAYLFMSARVVDLGDFNATVALARMAGQVVDGVGLFCFGPASEVRPTEYKPISVPRDVGMDQVLYRASQDLVALREQDIEPIPPSLIGPSAEALDALEKTGWDAADDDSDRT